MYLDYSILGLAADHNKGDFFPLALPRDILR